MQYNHTNLLTEEEKQMLLGIVTVLSALLAALICVGVGGGILDKEALKTGDYERIRTLAKDYVSAVE